MDYDLTTIVLSLAIIAMGAIALSAYVLADNVKERLADVWPVIRGHRDAVILLQNNLDEEIITLRKGIANNNENLGRHSQRDRERRKELLDYIDDQDGRLARGGQYLGIALRAMNSAASKQQDQIDHLYEGVEMLGTQLIKGFEAAVADLDELADTFAGYLGFADYQELVNFTEDVNGEELDLPEDDTTPFATWVTNNDGDTAAGFKVVESESVPPGSILAYDLNKVYVPGAWLDEMSGDLPAPGWMDEILLGIAEDQAFGRTTDGKPVTFTVIGPADAAGNDQGEDQGSDPGTQPEASGDPDGGTVGDQPGATGEDYPRGCGAWSEQADTPVSPFPHAFDFHWYDPYPQRFRDPQK